MGTGTVHGALRGRKVMWRRPAMPSPLADAPPELRRIEEDLPYQRRTWRFERIGWVLMALFVLAALLGATGSGGPLVRVEATTPDGALRIRYDRIQRQGAPTTLRFAARAAPPGGTLDLRLDRVFLDGWRLEPGVPVPTTAAAGPEGLRLRFATAASGGAAPPVVALHATPDGWFRLARPEVALGDGPPARLFILVWP
jgi:hypothetical protein